MKTVDVVKWLATVIQLVGYGLTGLNWTPYLDISRTSAGARVMGFEPKVTVRSFAA